MSLGLDAHGHRKWSKRLGRKLLVVYDREDAPVVHKQPVLLVMVNRMDELTEEKVKKLLAEGGKEKGVEVRHAKRLAWLGHLSLNFLLRSSEVVNISKTYGLIT